MIIQIIIILKRKMHSSIFVAGAKISGGLMLSPQQVQGRKPGEILNGGGV